jgi:hypothetical protein
MVCGGSVGARGTMVLSRTEPDKLVRLRSTVLLGRVLSFELGELSVAHREHAGDVVPEPCSVFCVHGVRQAQVHDDARGWFAAHDLRLCRRTLQGQQAALCELPEQPPEPARVTPVLQAPDAAAALPHAALEVL